MAFARSGKAEIYFEVHGEGPPVVFAHGRGGSAASWWQQLPTFERQYRVILFDHRCFGRSRCPTEEFDRTKFDSDLVAVLDAAGVDSAFVVCQSMGGWTGLRTALNFPDRVRALVLSNTPAAVDLPSVRQALERARDAFQSKGVGNVALAPDFPLQRPEAAFLYQQLNSLNLQIPAALAYGSEGWIEPSELLGFQHPTLFITAEQDHLLPPAVIREVADLFPGAEFQVLPDAGHSAYFETPETWNEVVLSFLAHHA